MEQRIYRYIFLTLIAGLVACAAAIIHMLGSAPRLETFSNAHLVREVFFHAAI